MTSHSSNTGSREIRSGNTGNITGITSGNITAVKYRTCYNRSIDGHPNRTDKCRPPVGTDSAFDCYELWDKLPLRTHRPGVDEAKYLYHACRPRLALIPAVDCSRVAIAMGEQDPRGDGASRPNNNLVSSIVCVVVVVW